MSLRDIFSLARNPAREPKPPTLQGAVVDTGNNTLVAIGSYAPALFFLNESMMDTEYVPNIVLTDDLLRVMELGPRAYPELSWNNPKRTFNKTNPATITEDMRERAVLAAKKVKTISRVIYWINRLRSKTNTGLLFQEVIYAEKKKQAQLLKDADFNETLAIAAPYVFHYANDNGIPLRQAAEEILFQSRLDYDHLAKTEKIRLGLFKKIRLAGTVEELDDILNAYRNDGVV